jgi:prefoldin subunit 5
MDERDYGRELDTLAERVDSHDKELKSINKCIADIDKRINSDITEIKTKLEYIEQNLGNINANIRWVVITLLGGIFAAIINIIL